MRRIRRLRRLSLHSRTVSVSGAALFAERDRVRRPGTGGKIISMSVDAEEHVFVRVRGSVSHTRCACNRVRLHMARSVRALTPDRGSPAGHAGPVAPAVR